MTFQNPQNGYSESPSVPGLWCFLFGGLYFASKGIWRHFFIAFVLALLTFGISWIIYPFFAADIVRRHYLKNGWLEI